MSHEDSLFERAVTSKVALESFPGAIMVPGWTDNVVQIEKWKKYGYLPLFALYEDGVHFDEDGDPMGSHVIDQQTPYGTVISLIADEISKGELYPTAYADAVYHLFKGDFDESEWSSYLPEQQDDTQ